MIDFDPVKLASVPHLSILPMTVIAIWGAIDGTLAKMLSHMMTSDFGIAVAMFQALKSQESQRAAISGAAEKALSPDDYRLLQAVWKVTKASRDRRHEYAHHLWGIPNIPDALALLDPRDSLKQMVSFEEQMDEYSERMSQWTRRTSGMNIHQRGHTYPMPPSPPSEEPDYSNVKCFTKTDLEDDVKDAEQARLWFLELQRALFDRSPQASNEARQRLLGAPQIAQALQPLSSGTPYSQTEQRPRSELPC
jgi:hypothetical protein